MTRFSTLTLSALVLASSATLAGDVEDAVDYRQGVMNVFSWNLEHMGAMVKGETAFDADAFKGYAADLASASKLDVLKGFPEDSVDDDSDALDEIWLKWSDFEAKLQDLRDQSAKLAEVAATGDEAAMKAQFAEVGGACKACHKAYKD
jgi:cytochrome c556